MDRTAKVIRSSILVAGLIAVAMTFLIPVVAHGPSARGLEAAAFALFMVLSCPTGLIVCSLPIRNPEFIFIAFPISIIGNAFLVGAIMNRIHEGW